MIRLKGFLINVVLQSGPKVNYIRYIKTNKVRWTDWVGLTDAYKVREYTEFFLKGLETLIAVVFCKECVLPVQWWFLFCKGGEDGRGTDGGGGRTKTRIARPKHIIKSCVKMHMNSNIHNEFPAPFKLNYKLVDEVFHLLPPLTLNWHVIYTYIQQTVSCISIKINIWKTKSSTG